MTAAITGLLTVYAWTVSDLMTIAHEKTDLVAQLNIDKTRYHAMGRILISWSIDISFWIPHSTCVTLFTINGYHMGMLWYPLAYVAVFGWDLTILC
jgi:hypothetical protein